MITYRATHDIDLTQLAALFRVVGWGWRAEDPAKFAQMIAGSLFVESAWDGERMVGFARAISDGVTNAYVCNVSVLPEYERRGIGAELVRRLVDGRDGIRFVLHARPELHEFYAKHGFEEATDMLRRDRRV